MADKKSPGRGPAFAPGDTITNGSVYYTIKGVTRTSYQLQAGNYIPISLTDRLWTKSDNEGEIVE